MPKVAARFALPREYEDAGVRRYGFHGLSYEYIAGRLRDVAPHLAAGRVIVAHLGNGASLCAMRQGRSVDTTMGFTALDGLVMGTRCGSLDPGVILYLEQQHGMSAKAGGGPALPTVGPARRLRRLSSDMRVLLASADPRAKEAIELFVFRIAREIGALTSSLGRARRPGLHRRHRRARAGDPGDGRCAARLARPRPRSGRQRPERRHDQHVEQPCRGAGDCDRRGGDDRPAHPRYGRTVRRRLRWINTPSFFRGDLEVPKACRRPAMATTTSTETPGAPATDPASLAQQNFERLAFASTRFMKGLANIAATQFELSRELMDGGVSDFNLLAQARTPEALVEAELEVFRRRSERAVGAVKKISDQMSGAWTEACEFAQLRPIGGASRETAPAARRRHRRADHDLGRRKGRSLRPSSIYAASVVLSSASPTSTASLLAAPPRLPGGGPACRDLPQRQSRAVRPGGYKRAGLRLGAALRRPGRRSA